MVFRELFTVCLAAVSVTLMIATGAFAQSAPLEIPFVHDWASSPHAKMSEEPFTHWNEEGFIPTDCARCHSTAGLQDYLGADGSEEGTVDKPALAGVGGIMCVACHNSATRNLTVVKFPSGEEVERFSSDARCMLCHQGRESTVSVNEMISKAGAGDDDVSDDVKFINIHYRAAAATRFGTEVKGGYEYDGKDYVGLYVHDEASTLCTDCHDNHTTRVTVDRCTECHDGLEKKADFHKIRTSKKDFDGNGNLDEGIAVEIDTLHDALDEAIKAYAKDVAGTSIVYDPHNYPYFFVDKNENGAVDPGEAVFPNKYGSWTPRLVRAAYNYQYVAKDPGAYTHNPYYVIELLQDSLADLATKVDVPQPGTNRP